MSKDARVFVVVGVLALSFLMLDLALPLGVAGGVPYVLCVLMALRSSRDVHVMVVAIVCALLTLAGFALSSPGAEMWIVLTNRALAIFAIFVTAVLGAQRKRSELKLAASLQEKEVLLKEVHHRVKNNLQIVSSILALQSNELSEAGGRAAFEEARDRIRVIAHLHEELYSSGDLAHIDLAAYLGSVVSDVVSAVNRKESVTCQIEIEPLLVTIDTAVPCGLLVNEVVTNSLKYAFPDGLGGRVEVSARSDPDGRCRLRIADDGVGLPESVDVDSSPTLGWSLVRALAGQLDGELQLVTRRPVVVELQFPVPSLASRDGAEETGPDRRG